MTLVASQLCKLTPVHIIFDWKGVLVSGDETSGRRGVKGLMRSRNRTVVNVSHRLIAWILFAGSRLTAAHLDGVEGLSALELFGRGWKNEEGIVERAVTCGRRTSRRQTGGMKGSGIVECSRYSMEVARIKASRCCINFRQNVRSVLSLTRNIVYPWMLNNLNSEAGILPNLDLRLIISNVQRLSHELIFLLICRLEGQHRRHLCLQS